MTQIPMMPPNCHCLKCGYSWFSAIASLGRAPKVCPSCHRYDYFLPRVRKSRKRLR